MSPKVIAFLLLAGCDAAGPPPHDWTSMEVRVDS